MVGIMMVIHTNHSAFMSIAKFLACLFAPGLCLQDSLLNSFLAPSSSSPSRPARVGPARPMWAGMGWLERYLGPSTTSTCAVQPHPARCRERLQLHCSET